MAIVAYELMAADLPSLKKFMLKKIEKYKPKSSGEIVKASLRQFLLDLHREIENVINDVKATKEGVTPDILKSHPEINLNELYKINERIIITLDDVDHLEIWKQALDKLAVPSIDQLANPSLEKLVSPSLSEPESLTSRMANVRERAGEIKQKQEAQVLAPASKPRKPMLTQEQLDLAQSTENLREQVSLEETRLVKSQERKEGKDLNDKSKRPNSTLKR